MAVLESLVEVLLNGTRKVKHLLLCNFGYISSDKSEVESVMQLLSQLVAECNLTPLVVMGFENFKHDFDHFWKRILVAISILDLGIEFTIQSTRFAKFMGPTCSSRVLKKLQVLRLSFFV